MNNIIILFFIDIKWFVCINIKEFLQLSRQTMHPSPQQVFPHGVCSCERPFVRPPETLLHKRRTYVLSYHVSWLDGPSTPTLTPTCSCIEGTSFFCNFQLQKRREKDHQPGNNSCFYFFEMIYLVLIYQSFA